MRDGIARAIAGEIDDAVPDPQRFRGEDCHEGQGQNHAGVEHREFGGGLAPFERSAAFHDTPSNGTVTMGLNVIGMGFRNGKRTSIG